MNSGGDDLTEAIWPFIRLLYVTDPADPKAPAALRASNAFAVIRREVLSGAPLVVRLAPLMPEAGYRSSAVASFATIDEVFYLIQSYYVEKLPGSPEALLVQKAIRVMTDMVLPPPIPAAPAGREAREDDDLATTLASGLRLSEGGARRR